MNAQSKARRIALSVAASDGYLRDLCKPETALENILKITKDALISEVLKHEKT